MYCALGLVMMPHALPSNHTHAGMRSNRPASHARGIPAMLCPMLSAADAPARLVMVMAVGHVLNALHGLNMPLIKAGRLSCPPWHMPLSYAHARTCKQPAVWAAALGGAEREPDQARPEVEPTDMQQEGASVCSACPTQAHPLPSCWAGCRGTAWQDEMWRRPAASVPMLRP